MGVIQGSINNLLTIAAASARLSPKTEKRLAEEAGERQGIKEATARKAELGELTKQSRSAYEKSKEQYEKIPESNRKTYETLKSRQSDIEKHLANVEKLYALEPSEELRVERESLYQASHSAAKEYSDYQEKQLEKGKRAQATRKAKEALEERGKEVLNSLTNWRNL